MGIKAVSEDGADVFEQYLTGFQAEFYDTKYDRKKSRKLLDHSGDPVLDELFLCVETNTKAEYVFFYNTTRTAGTLDFTVNFIMVYPESLTAGEIDADAAKTQPIIDSFVTAIGAHPEFGDALDASSVTAELVLGEEVFKASPYTPSEREASIFINADPSKTEPLYNSLYQYFKYPSKEDGNPIRGLMGQLLSESIIAQLPDYAQEAEVLPR